MMFVEGKWLYNHVLSLSKKTDIFAVDYTDIPVLRHYDKDKNPIESKPCWLSSQMKQSVVSQFKTNIVNLARAKRRGIEVGSLDYISELNSINLKQPNVSYKIVGGNRIRVQGIKKPLKVNGLEQLSRFSTYELANAKLLQRPNGYFIALTVYAPCEEDTHSNNRPDIGVDFGCQTTLTLSNGEKIKATVEESETVKRIRRKISNAEKGSNNRWKLKLKLRKALSKDNNRKNDLANKIAHRLLSEYSIVMQDELLASWQENGHGKAISKGILGRLKTRLMNDENTFIIDKSVPTTKTCTHCGHKQTLSLYDRTFVCDECGFTTDRDVHAAKNMVWMKQHTPCVERTCYNSEDFQRQLHKATKGQSGSH